jgi:hypothetical protein
MDLACRNFGRESRMRIVLLRAGVDAADADDDVAEDELAAWRERLGRN